MYITQNKKGEENPIVTVIAKFYIFLTVHQNFDCQIFQNC
jgi:hypothetical protein